MSTVLLQKLDSLQRCITRIEAKTPSQLELFRSDIDAQDILILNLQRAVQLAVDICAILIQKAGSKPAGTMREVFEIAQNENILDEKLALSMVNAVGFRNIAVHQYKSLDLDLVYTIAQKSVQDLRFFLDALKHNIEEME